MGRNRNKGVNCFHVSGVAYQDKYSLSSLASLCIQGVVQWPENLQNQAHISAACISFAETLMSNPLDLLKNALF